MPIKKFIKFELKKNSSKSMNTKPTLEWVNRPESYPYITINFLNEEKANIAWKNFIKNGLPAVINSENSNIVEVGSNEVAFLQLVSSIVEKSSEEEPSPSPSSGVSLK